ncbi:flagellar biosynthetic protein FliR [Fuchsiella alkaliacetigena]|uniref:flagellar biosynthetic protein FliR n=1 Tax=Fuchsiella alkaliacetigena TaxID=957042 RepID=UPI00200B9746|nr:flagellar biosynthetic protein FliR [Fuchsiella alkaliacetigena]MCK8823535.1 flagellar type III secretion system protein FliR [Fuchsiella alkaliacetigena]
MELELIEIIYEAMLIMSRVIGLFLIAPFYGSQAIPQRVKAAFAFMVTLVLRNVVTVDYLELPANIFFLAIDLLGELTIGLIIGFIVFLLFVAIQLAGQFLDMRMGLAMANIMDPEHASPTALTGQFKNILAILLFLVLNGHHFLLRAIAQSFTVVPLTELLLTDNLFVELLKIVGELYPIAFKIALPLIAVLFLTDLVFGLAVRAVPQMNIFVVGLPTKMLVGFLVLSMLIPIYVSTYRSLFREMFGNINQIITILGDLGG